MQNNMMKRRAIIVFFVIMLCSCLFMFLSCKTDIPPENKPVEEVETATHPHSPENNPPSFRPLTHAYDRVLSIALDGDDFFFAVACSEKEELELFKGCFKTGYLLEINLLHSLPLTHIQLETAQLLVNSGENDLWLFYKNGEDWELLTLNTETQLTGLRQIPFTKIGLSSNTVLSSLFKDNIFYARQRETDKAFVVKNNLDLNVPMDLFAVSLLSEHGKISKVAWLDVFSDDSLFVYALENTETGRAELWLHDIAENHRKMLATEQIITSMPRWSPNGEWISYCKEAGNGSTFVLYETATALQKLINISVKVQGGHTWSVDGSRIVFAAEVEEQERIFLLDLEKEGVFLDRENDKNKTTETAAEVKDELRDELGDVDVEVIENGEQILYDIAILNGTVIDPETETFKFGYNVGVKGERIAVVTRETISGKEEIDATGLVISPGFIDILSYSPNDVGNRFKVADGVTTNLAMHGAATDFKSWFAGYARRNMILNYGGAVLHGRTRYQLGLGIFTPPSAAQIEQMKKITERAILDGAIGLSFSPEYYPGMTEEETMAVMEIGKKYDMVSFFHVRYSTMYGPGGNNFDALNEVFHYARELDVPAQVVHINSTGGTFSMQKSLEMIDAARAEGLDITIDLYPYNYWATYANSARFAPGWQTRFQIDYGDLQVANSTERLTKESFERYRQTRTLLIAFAIPEEDVELALLADYAMIGSDTIIEPHMNNHPRGAGCFSRTIGVYARDKNFIPLMKALRMMTVLPAQRLENVAPALKNKGRLKEGKDADITIFDYAEIIDTATPENIANYSAGVHYVLVNGTIVKDKDGFRQVSSPGKPIRSYFDQGVRTD